MFPIVHINVNHNVWILDKEGNPSPGVEFFFAIRTAELPINEVYIYYDLIEGTWVGGDNIYCDEWRELSEEEVSRYVENYDLNGMLYDD